MNGDHANQVEALSNDLDRLIDRYRAEYDLLYAEVVGVLFMKATTLCKEAEDQSEESE